MAVILEKTFDSLSVAFPRFAGRSRKPGIWHRFTVNRTRVFPLLSQLPFPDSLSLFGCRPARKRELSQHFRATALPGCEECRDTVFSKVNITLVPVSGTPLELASRRGSAQRPVV